MIPPESSAAGGRWWCHLSNTPEIHSLFTGIFGDCLKSIWYSSSNIQDASVSKWFKDPVCIQEVGGGAEGRRKRLVWSNAMSWIAMDFHIRWERLLQSSWTEPITWIEHHNWINRYQETWLVAFLIKLFFDKVGLQFVFPSNHPQMIYKCWTETGQMETAERSQCLPIASISL